VVRLLTESARNPEKLISLYLCRERQPTRLVPPSTCCSRVWCERERKGHEALWSTVQTCRYG